MSDNLLRISPALLLVSFLNPVFAQQGSGQARLLLEMQSMRKEIAELRDMVERQQYQIEQQKSHQPEQLRSQAQQPGNASVTAPTYPVVENNQINYQKVPGPEPSANQPVVRQPTQQTPPNDGSIRPIERIGNQSVVEQPQANNPVNQTEVDGIPTEDVVINNPQVAPGEQPYPPVHERVVVGGDVITESAVGSQTKAPQADLPPTAAPRQASTPQVDGSQVDSFPIVEQDAPVSGSANEAELYRSAFNLIKQSKHDEAIQAFKKQITTYPNGDYVDDAYYWIGESMYVDQKFTISKKYFKEILDNYQSSPRYPDAKLKTAYIEQKQGNNIEARILLQEIINNHPSSNAAIAAKNRISELK